MECDEAQAGASVSSTALKLQQQPFSSTRTEEEEEEEEGWTVVCRKKWPKCHYEWVTNSDVPETRCLNELVVMEQKRNISNIYMTMERGGKYKTGLAGVLHGGKKILHGKFGWTTGRVVYQNCSFHLECSCLLFTAFPRARALSLPV